MTDSCLELCKGQIKSLIKTNGSFSKYNVLLLACNLLLKVNLKDKFGTLSACLPALLLLHLFDISGVIIKMSPVE